MGGISFRLGLACAFAIVSAAQSSAATLTANYAISGNNVAIQSFDATLGTLTAISIGYSANFSEVIGTTNFGGGAKSFSNLVYSVPILVSAPGLSFSSTFTSAPQSGTIGVGFGTINISGIASGSGSVSSAFLAAYDVGTPVNLQFSYGSAGISGTPSGVSLAATPPTLVGFPSGLTVQYTYDVPVATPLPAALPLFLTGLTGLGIIALRRPEKRRPA